MFLHLDMNSYFASVEQQANPLWRDKPVGVCAYLSKNSCILASSIEAKKLGIKTGCTVAQAKKIYPQIILVENQPYKYLSTTKKIFKILQNKSDKFEAYSIDEGFLDLTALHYNFLSAEKLATDIRRDIKSAVGAWLRCSIGIAQTKFLAKLASDTAGPDETLIINKNNLINILKKLKLTDVWGIGEKTAKKLNELGIYSPLEFKNYPLENILTSIGQNGYYLWQGLNEKDIGKFNDINETAVKSIGHSYCLPKQTTDLNYLLAILYKLCLRTGKKLRQQNLFAKKVWAGYVCLNGKSNWRTYSSIKIINNTDALFNLAKKCLIEPLPDRVRMLAISTYGLIKDNGQMSLFAKNEKNIQKAIDDLNDKFGAVIIQKGKIFGLEKQAQFRIGFRKITELN